MVFPPGITGFDVPKAHAEADPRTFREDCWQVATSLDGRAENRRQVLDARFTSFLAQVLVLPTIEMTVVLNKVHPWVGFCRPLEPGECLLEFVDPAPLAAAFAALGRYRVLSQAELDQAVSDSMCVELGDAERHQLKYWSKSYGRGSLRVGDVVFNFWD